MSQANTTPTASKTKRIKEKTIEVDLTGDIVDVPHLLVPFSRNVAEIVFGDAEQASVLPKVADVLKKQKGAKLLLEGHREPDEKEGTDHERCLSVFEWLVEAAGCPPGNVRVKGRSTSCGEGRCVVPLLIEELIVRSGPVNKEVETCPNAQPGLFFTDSSINLSSQAKSILDKMAQWMFAEDATYFRIEGHVDSKENVALGLQRAEVVRDYLTTRGVNTRQLKPHSCGNRHPASRLHMELNRRVELHVD